MTDVFHQNHTVFPFIVFWFRGCKKNRYFRRLIAILSHDYRTNKSRYLRRLRGDFCDMGSHDLHISTILLFLLVIESGFSSTLDISFRQWDPDHELLLETFAVAVCEKTFFFSLPRLFLLSLVVASFLEFYSKLHQISSKNMYRFRYYTVLNFSIWR